MQNEKLIEVNEEEIQPQACTLKQNFLKNPLLLILTLIVLLALTFALKLHLSSSVTHETEPKPPPAFALQEEPLFSLIPVIPQIEKEVILLSQLPDINEAFISRPSQIPRWLTAALKQQVQPSPRRIVDIKIDNDTDDSLVVRDRVVVIPKNLHPVKPLAMIKTPNSLSTPLTKALKKPFTIQLLASRNAETLRQIIKTHNLSREAAIRLTKRDGLDWYVLTLGYYAQIEEAQVAIKKLRSEFSEFKPWVRPISQLKALG